MFKLTALYTVAMKFLHHFSFSLFSIFPFYSSCYPLLSFRHSWVLQRRAEQVENSVRRGRTDKRKCVVSRKPRWERARNETVTVHSEISLGLLSLMFCEYFKPDKLCDTTVLVHVPYGCMGLHDNYSSSIYACLTLMFTLQYNCSF